MSPAAQAVYQQIEDCTERDRQAVDHADSIEREVDSLTSTLTRLDWGSYPYHEVKRIPPTQEESHMPRQTTYLIYRHGSNAANQSMTQTAPVGYEVATSRWQAEQQMAQRVTVYANQFLYALPISRTPLADRAAADEAEAAREAFQPALVY